MTTFALVALVGFAAITIVCLATGILGPLESAPFLVVTILVTGYTTWVCVSGATAPHVLTIEEKAQILRTAGKDQRVLAEARGWITAHTQASLQDLQKEAGALQHLKDAEFVKKTLGTQTWTVGGKRHG